MRFTWSPSEVSHHQNIIRKSNQFACWRYLNNAYNTITEQPECLKNTWILEILVNIKWLSVLWFLRVRTHSTLRLSILSGAWNFAKSALGFWLVRMMSSSVLGSDIIRFREQHHRYITHFGCDKLKTSSKHHAVETLIDETSSKLNPV